jgi:hypothetical protein
VLTVATLMVGNMFWNILEMRSRCLSDSVAPPIPERTSRGGCIFSLS